LEGSAGQTAKLLAITTLNPHNLEAPRRRSVTVPDPVAVPRIVTVAAYKGGVGKTTIALELAYLLAAPLVDLDWDQGERAGGGATATRSTRPARSWTPWSASGHRSRRQAAARPTSFRAIPT
jgi:hypothetical protein